ncbi:MAG: CHASE3 domain-containing protein [Xanthomonadales bacterium]|nr:CHASE3 domain-containing protein [Xanthomonadales bacterium]
MTLAVEPATNPELDFPGRRRFARRVSVMFLLLGLILSTIAVQVYRAVGDFVDAARWVNHSLGVRQEITLTLGSLHSAEASQRAYFISGNVQRLGDYTATAPQIAAHTAKLAELVADDPEQLGAARSWRPCWRPESNPSRNRSRCTNAVASKQCVRRFRSGAPVRKTPASTISASACCATRIDCRQSANRA